MNRERGRERRRGGASALSSAALRSHVPSPPLPAIASLAHAGVSKGAGVSSTPPLSISAAAASLARTMVSKGAGHCQPPSIVAAAATPLVRERDPTPLAFPSAGGEAAAVRERRGVDRTPSPLCLPQRARGGGGGDGGSRPYPGTRAGCPSERRECERRQEGEKRVGRTLRVLPCA
jgi:hypothetical protein